MSEMSVWEERLMGATKARGLDALTMLATGIQAQPGVYAVLLGSGVSTTAGIPTGWGVMQDLVKRAATAKDPNDGESIALAASDPEAWWLRHGDGQALDYSNLLEQLAPTGPTRRDLLGGYFEATDEQAAAGEKVPTKAHRSVAQLVRRGSVRVIVTTNFDRLMEHALDELSVSHQVIHRADQIPAMTPLTHAKATVIKVHGDYHDQDMRNTVNELKEYPKELVTLLGQILDEFGLVISGWSADWDRALVAALETRRTRRYPLYWDKRSSKGETASRLLGLHGGHIVAAVSADDLFTGLVERVEALDRLAEPPLTTAVAVARLKRYLPDPVRRIDLHDLLMDATDRIVDHIGEQPLNAPSLSYADVDALYQRYLDVTVPLLRLVTVGVWHAEDNIHGDLWRDVLQKLLDARVQPEGGWTPLLDRARLYPALLTLQAMGLVAVRRGNDALLLRLLTEPQVRDFDGSSEPQPAAQALHYVKVLDHDMVNAFPRWEPTKWLYPASHMLKSDLREVVQDFIQDETTYKTCFHAVEYRVGLVQNSTKGLAGAYPAAQGEFVGQGQWTTDDGPRPEVAFRKALAKAGDSGPWGSILGEDLNAHLLTYRETLKGYERW
jgi:hypothetical protein